MTIDKRRMNSFSGKLEYDFDYLCHKQNQMLEILYELEDMTEDMEDQELGDRMAEKMLKLEEKIGDLI